MRDRDKSRTDEGERFWGPLSPTHRRKYDAWGKGTGEEHQSPKPATESPRPNSLPAQGRNLGNQTMAQQRDCNSTRVSRRKHEPQAAPHVKPLTSQIVARITGGCQMKNCALGPIPLYAS